MKKNSKRLLLSLAASFLLLVIISDFRAYLYSDNRLEALAEKRLFEDFSRYTSCDELRFLKTSEMRGVSELIAMQWVCLNLDDEQFLISAVVQSDGFVEVSRMAMSKEEIARIIELNDPSRQSGS